jgi:glutamate-1-semialdehyde 2,1-aminomutase
MPATTLVNGALRRTPVRVSSLDPRRVEQLLTRERRRYLEHTSGSAAADIRACGPLPLGVPSSFQRWDPYPISIVEADGAWVVDVDGRRLLDLSMGFGALLVGHLHPHVMARARLAMTSGTLFVAPSPVTTDAAERVCARFGLDQVRFTNSGTESLMYAIRVAKAYTGRDGIIKVEGGYHGGYDPLMVSVKPSLELAGPSEKPNSVIPAGITSGDVAVVAYNDAAQLESLLQANPGRYAAFVMEPVLENIAIVLPDTGYLEEVREICDRHGVVLIFDEVKTGLTAGAHGAAKMLGVQPDLATFAKSIAGGFPVGAFGGRREIMDTVTSGSAAHFGTFNGNPLAMAAVIAVDEIVTDQRLKEATARNARTIGHLNTIIDQYELPAHTVGFGVKGCLTWSATPVRNYRDYKRTDFEAAELNWLYLMNSGIITPAGLDEQWLVSLAHTEADMNLLVGTFKALVSELRS